MSVTPLAPAAATTHPGIDAADAAHAGESIASPAIAARAADSGPLDTAGSDAITPLPRRSSLRKAITRAWRLSEPEAVPPLLAAARVSPVSAERITTLARRIAQGLRDQPAAPGKSGLVQGLLQEFSLSSQEGVALMCLAEALLRIPDSATRDALIRDKVRGGNWKDHVGQSPSVFVNAAAWGLMLTGKLVATHNEAGMGSTLSNVMRKGGEPLIRKGVDVAMRLMGEQFVTGETIGEALRNARHREAAGYRYSYDMLGEAALTSSDAARYFADYAQAIHAIGKASAGRGIQEGPGISIKLSALHPRYSRAQIDRVHDELYPSVLQLAEVACQYDIGLNIDAEEADRLELSLDLLERLCAEPSLRGWQGIGFVIQAYQKRCPAVVDYLVDLARRSGRRLMVRLVKGAYWDSEIKRAQIDGLDDYPVYTRKPYTDLSYIACARKLLAAPDQIYPQFATHNAHTLAAIYELADPAAWKPGQYEFQCLHGMGESLYDQVVGTGPDTLARPCRIYAPVGTHETLLAYLVRRLLENGANSSFVNQVADPSIPLDALVQDPVAQVDAMTVEEGRTGLPHPVIPLPAHLYGHARANSRGIDLANDDTLAHLAGTLRQHAADALCAGPMLASHDANDEAAPSRHPAKGSLESTFVDDLDQVADDTRRGMSDMPASVVDVINPADHHDLVGKVRHATPADVDAALAAAANFAPTWASVPPIERAFALERAADALQSDTERLIGILVREAGKTYAAAVAEVREAVDFLRYYAWQVSTTFDNATHRPLGPVVCISPWNFPLAIFTGQIAAALAAGNTVLAKPAEQTSLIAAEAVRVLWDAGIPRAALQMLPGSGQALGPLLVDDPRVQAVMFTGSTAVARQLQRSLATRLGASGKPIPLVAETGGQNAMIVDSSALAEQAVQDIVQSAFDSAGQRCSALRVLYVQHDVADRLIGMLTGAMKELRLGNPARLHTDVGPVIDVRARDTIQNHIDAMRAKGFEVVQAAWGDAVAREAAMEQGTFIPPTLITLPSLRELKQEVFGPVLHVIRYRREDLDAVLRDIAATGYGLTMGLHTRIDETIAQVARQAHVGNLYVNRNMVGAVVGVQPFGGEGLSGTGPKAGGPLYLLRLLADRPDNAIDLALQGLVKEEADATSPKAAEPRAERRSAVASGPAAALGHWCAQQGFGTPTPLDLPMDAMFVLAGPTGERNTYRLVPRVAVLCVAMEPTALLAITVSVLAVGSRAVWDAGSPNAASLHQSLPPEVRAHITLQKEGAEDAGSPPIASAIHQGTDTSLLTLLARMAARDGAIVPVYAITEDAPSVPLESLVMERAVSTNTAAAGGNASLMTMT
ncbi:bifunctional proline dehydrogenase/L-glutamate gamma-semialdehyde dehydrogenase PutA [Pigmentiphaga litoralis]|uniref:Bifunctional protein PutA n=1 Tax=Pigmentiphaga litoralis TaxID=516702 RepID=A0A7Y9IYW9_9BURK|nr:bifunctional proline dehydrogenase/L-glutamate gamma-semialdehyde dehydrogenase PutA [Pigmentiphaga litoralis]NYE26447.1 RHH-type proline utilization regulon transcriptional repressor/proline dehydrogenase/delta 1-pyrroline-5-carboxylate dehydrogenase [Pigmentiphaga litoralis]NYE85567.1 RHH-type proline utilization regulon transcriptional repressor/proline dehydrogenase/delta 1-pyrroline-5-carboxylate dehydrogenase [Pigmentiphaga litoralis]